MMDAPPVSPACERNRDPILRVIRQVFHRPGEVLEIGSGTGQHAVYFARHLSHLVWHASDRDENHPGIRAWKEMAALPNLYGPYRLDVRDTAWPVSPVDGVFSANTAHIMDESAVEALFAGAGRVLRAGGAFCLYGPFRFHGDFTSDSNRAFDRDLRRRDPSMGIRDAEALEGLARSAGLRHEARHDLPANNQLMVWRRDAQ
jgi:SAM-dependent methyltransferase